MMRAFMVLVQVFLETAELGVGIRHGSAQRVMPFSQNGCTIDSFSVSVESGTGWVTYFEERESEFQTLLNREARQDGCAMLPSVSTNYQIDGMWRVYGKCADPTDNTFQVLTLVV